MKTPGWFGPALRILAAAGLLVGGGVHLRLYFRGYRSVPDANLGRSFLANAIGSLVVALVLLVWDRWPALVAGLAVANGSLVAFALSRTHHGIFGFTEKGWNPSPYGVTAIVAEIVAAAALCLLWSIRLGAGHPSRGTDPRLDLVP